MSSRLALVSTRCLSFLPLSLSPISRGRGLPPIPLAAMLLMAVMVPATAQVTLLPDWTQQSPANSPPARAFAAMTYDQNHHQALLFGGYGGSLMNDTWTWDGSNWSQQSPANSPSARENAAIAYDPINGNAVLFGGYDGFNYLSDTWTWDGNNWSQRNPGKSPPYRYGATMTYDAGNNQVVLFGGRGDNGYLNDTWTWDGINWTNQSPVNSPSARFGATMVYDPIHGNSVLFGGEDTNNVWGDTWIWDGTYWTQQSPANSPPARQNAAAAYDVMRGNAMFFGGYNRHNFFNDTWTWDGGDWTLQSSATSPPVRGYSTMIYDADHDRPMLFGGSSNAGSLGDTWTFQSGTFNFGRANVCISGTTPAPCTQHATFRFDVSSGTTIGAINVLTQGAANLDFQTTTPDSSTTLCTATTYSSETVCTVDVTFAPRFTGQRLGAVVLSDSSKNPLYTEYVYGTGIGPQLSFANTTSGAYIPNAQIALGSGSTNPLGVAVDGSGNIFVADSSYAVKEIVAAGGYTTVNTLAGGFNDPFFGVAVDGSGNVFVADTYNNAVKEIVAAGGYTTVNVLSTGFNRPAGVAVDGSGNVFVADSYNNAVKELVAAGGYATVNSLGSGFNYPNGVAVDGSGNVFVADYGNNAVKEIVAAGGYTTVNTLGGGFSQPYGVAVDGGGNVFVTDVNQKAIKEIVAAGGYTTVNTLGSGFIEPLGVVVDGSGNVFVGDPRMNGVVKLDYADPPSFSFASANVGSQSSDSPQSITVSNIGNADLTVPVLAANNPSLPSGFTLDTATTCPQLSTSSAAGTLPAGTSCVYGVDFIPAASGVNSGSLLLTDNNLNAAAPGYATQSIGLSGTGLGTAPAVTTNPSSQTVTAGGPATFIAAATGSPTPTVQWQVSIGGAAFTNIGGATSTTLSFSTTTIQNGNRYQAVFLNSVGSVTTTVATLTVNYGPSITLNPSSFAVPVGSTATFTAAASGNPTPTVQWQVSSGGGTFANIAGATSTTLSFSTTAGQSGNRYRAVFTNTVGTAITTPATLTLKDFTISASPASQTISSGHSAVYKVSLASVNGLTGNVALACSGAPSHSTCTISPSTVMLNGTTSTTVNLSASMAANHGTFTLKLTGTVGNITHSTNVTLTVK